MQGDVLKARDLRQRRETIARFGRSSIHAASVAQLLQCLGIASVSRLVGAAPRRPPVVALVRRRCLKLLSDLQLLVLGARMALRVAPWCPIGGEETWSVAMGDLARACGGALLTPTLVRKYKQQLSKHGALGSYLGVPEPMWRSRNQAACVLGCALRATQLSARKDRWREVVQAGKHAASVFAVQAHAGVFPLQEALSLPWATARADVVGIVGCPAPTSLAELADIGPLWPGAAPLWAMP
ncbi:MAG: hypothetical protein ACI9VR_002606 [Cognaticolwellia sp.]|jgi:hypothetical protein